MLAFPDHQEMTLGILTPFMSFKHTQSRQPFSLDL
jgi:hypothetical protein